MTPLAMFLQTTQKNPIIKILPLVTSSTMPILILEMNGPQNNLADHLMQQNVGLGGKYIQFQHSCAQFSIWSILFVHICPLPGLEL